MRAILNFNLTLCLLIIFSSCNGQENVRQTDSKINIDSVYSQILKDSVLVTGWYYILDSGNGFKRQLDKSHEIYVIDPKPIVTKANFIKIEIFETDFNGAYPDYIGLMIMLDQDGINAWTFATRKSIHKKLALIINNKLIYTPIVNAEITNGMTTFALSA